MVGTAFKIVKKEGVLKLWSGLMPMLQRHAIYSGSRLIFYEKFRNFFRDSQGNTSLAAQSLCEIFTLHIVLKYEVELILKCSVDCGFDFLDYNLMTPLF